MTANSRAPRYDAREVLDHLPPLSHFFTRDDNAPQRIGSAWFSFCPVHSEKTRSCQVSDDKGKFHCYGCGAHGDVMDYWQHTRHQNFQEALADLAGIAGVSPGEWTPRRTSSSPRPAPVEAPLAPLTSLGMEKWTGACAQLAASPEEISRIAAWRGIDPEAVAWAARSGLMGIYPYFSHPREAFLVEGIGENGRIPVSVHIRLAPGSPGNTSSKASWRYDPPGVGSWPFVVGDLATAGHIFCLEGQWDVLALISIMGWHRGEWPASVAAFGLRGATSAGRLFRHQINPEATIFGFSDADAAGDKWFEPGGFYDQLAARLSSPHRLHAIRPCTQGADFNDMVKAGTMDRATVLDYVRPTLQQPRLAAFPAFTTWCRSAKHYHADPIVRAGANHVAADKKHPGARKPFRVWQKHWADQSLSDHIMACLLATWTAYEADRDRILAPKK